MRELATREGMSAPAVTAYLDRLEAAGLVQRSRSQDDRRRVIVAVTEKGLRVLRSARAARTAWLAARLRRLTREEIAAVDAAIVPLARLLEEER